MGGLGSIGKVIGKASSEAFKGLGGDAGILGAINPTALIGTAAAMGDSLYGAYANKKEAKKERDWQKYMVDYQNAYNTPAAQMARYAEAGLNPNLIYGQQNYSASTGSVPHASIPGLKLSDHALSALKLGQDLKLGQEQINQVQASVDLIRSQIGRTDAETAALLHDIALTPDFIGVKDNSTAAKIARGIYGISKGLERKVKEIPSLEQKAKETRKHSYDPSLPALGRNYKP